MKLILLAFSLLISAFAFSQDTTWKKRNDSSRIIVHKDARIDQLVKKQAQINEETIREGRRTAKGFRLMILNTDNREEAISAKSKIYTYFPELKAYLSYQSPYFRLKVGNFTDRKDAASYQKRLNVYFPKGVFIIPDIVEVRPDKLKEDSLELTP
jgi:hypothetical protein